MTQKLFAFSSVAQHRQHKNRFDTNRVV